MPKTPPSPKSTLKIRRPRAGDEIVLRGRVTRESAPAPANRVGDFVTVRINGVDVPVTLPVDYVEVTE